MKINWIQQPTTEAPSTSKAEPATDQVSTIQIHTNATATTGDDGEVVSTTKIPALMSAWFLFVTTMSLTSVSLLFVTTVVICNSRVGIVVICNNRVINVSIILICYVRIIITVVLLYSKI